MMLRYFTLVAPGELGDVGYAYLRALEDTGLLVRALPIGPATAMASEKRWYDVGHLFTVPMAIPFVNVVCAPLGFLMGTRAPVASLAGTGDLAKQDGRVRDVMVFPEGARAAVAQLLGGSTAKAHEDVIYEPVTAFSGLHTAGAAKNIAIVIDSPPDPTEAELAALERYDWVFTPKHEDGLVLKALGIRSVVHLPPDATALASFLLEEACASATSAPTTGSTATGAPPATTWLRSTPRVQTSSSKSRSLGTEDATPPRPGTRTSIASRSPGTKPTTVLRLMWSWLMRRLAFWRRSSR